MNTKTFLDRLSENWLAILICFAIAIIIVFFHSFSEVDKKNLTISLQVRSDGIMMPASKLGNSSYIKVTVRGAKDDIAVITENDLTAYIDISGATEEGVFEFPIVVQPDQKLLLMQSFEITPEPDTVSLRIEEKTFKYVPIVPTISGETAHGYEISATSCEPDVVRIIGPSSIVNAVNQVRTSRVAAENASSSFETDVRVINDNSFISIENERQSIHVNVDIAEKRMEYEFSEIPVYVRNVPDGFDISGMGYVNVVLEGPVLQIEKFLTSSIFAYCDCSGVSETGNVSVPVYVNIPVSSGLTFMRCSSDTMILKSELKMPAFEDGDILGDEE